MIRRHYEELLEQLDAQLMELGELVVKAIGNCVDALEKQDVAEAQRLIEADSVIDRKRYELEQQALLVIATQQPLAGDLRLLAAVLSIATELERIGDYCEGIAKLVLRMAAEPVGGWLDDIRSMAEVTQHLLREVLEAFKRRDMDAAARVWLRDDEVDHLYEKVFRQLIGEMAEDRSKVQQGTYLLWIAHNLERMADRVTNIAERIAFVEGTDIAAFRRSLRSTEVPS